MMSFLRRLSGLGLRGAQTFGGRSEQSADPGPDPEITGGTNLDYLNTSGSPSGGMSGTPCYICCHHDLTPDDQRGKGVDGKKDHEASHYSLHL